MRIIETKAYKFEELSEKAQKAAVDNNRTWNVDDIDWWDCTYEDFQEILTRLGFEVESRRIYFGLYRAGAGASFNGTYSYKVGSGKKLREHAPQDKELHAISDALVALQRKYFYRLHCDITPGHLSNHYSHENTVDIEVTDYEDLVDVTMEDEEEMSNTVKRLMRWMHKQLQEQYDYLVTDEAVKDSLIANEVEFTEDGGSL